MNKELRILILEDVPTDAELIEHELRKGGILFTSRRVETRDDFVEAIDEFAPDLILSDYKLPSFDGLSALKIAQEKSPHIPFIFVTGAMGEDMAVDLLKSGATDYVLKDRLSRLTPAVLRALKEVEERIEKERKEKALRESEERYRKLVGAVTDYIYTVRVENGRPVETRHGHGCVAVTGYTTEEYNADPFLWFNMIYGEDRDKVREQAEKVSRGEAVKPLEHRIFHKNGSIIWVRNTPVPRFDENGRLSAYDGLISDITERKKAEEALRQSKEFSEAVLNSIRDAIAIIDVNTYRIVNVNNSFLEVCGLKEGDVIGKTCYEITHHSNIPCNIPECPCPLTALLNNGESKLFEHIHYDKKGNRINLEILVSPIKDEKGSIIQIVHLSRDITEKRRLEEQLRQAQKMEAVGQLAGGVAHDFNNILTTIIGYGDLLKEELKDDDPLRPYINQVLSSAERAANLTKSLLAFSRKQIIAPKIIDINETVKGVEKLLKRLIGEDIELRAILNPSKEGITVMADKGQIEQVLMNLAANARDAMPDGGILSMETGFADITKEYAKKYIDVKPGRYALISVSDTGIGMDENTRNRIFEPFFTTKEKGKGTGLGLSIVYGIIKQHNGYINVYSETGKGTTFKIYLPAIEKGIKEEEKVLPSPKGGTETVLLAEDDKEVRGFTKTLLERHGYKVLEAADGEDAVNLFKDNKEKIKLVILDVIMPKKDGRTAYEEIKKIAHGIKALFLSGYTADIINKKGILDTELDFVSKPISPPDLLRKVREVLDR